MTKAAYFTYRTEIGGDDILNVSPDHKIDSCCWMCPQGKRAKGDFVVMK